jgi:hypothetical protein
VPVDDGQRHDDHGAVLAMGQLHRQGLRHEVVHSPVTTPLRTHDEGGGVDGAGQVRQRPVGASGQVAEVPRHVGAAQLLVQPREDALLALRPQVVIAEVGVDGMVAHRSVRVLLVDEPSRVGEGEIQCRRPRGPGQGQGGEDHEGFGVRRHRDDQGVPGEVRHPRRVRLWWQVWTGHLRLPSGTILRPDPQ